MQGRYLPILNNNLENSTTIKNKNEQTNGEIEKTASRNF
jgi:hypothetical protein